MTFHAARDNQRDTTVPAHGAALSTTTRKNGQGIKLMVGTELARMAGFTLDNLPVAVLFGDGTDWGHALIVPYPPKDTYKPITGHTAPSGVFQVTVQAPLNAQRQNYTVQPMRAWICEDETDEGPHGVVKAVMVELPDGFYGYALRPTGGTPPEGGVPVPEHVPAT